MELPGRPQRSFMDEAKEDMQRVGDRVEYQGLGEMDADDLL